MSQTKGATLGWLPYIEQVLSVELSLVEHVARQVWQELADVRVAISHVLYLLS